jgi:PAS domain S-box-containing protein
MQSRLILLLLFILIPVLAIQAYTYYGNYQAKRAEALQSNLELARILAKGFESFVQDVLHQEFAIGLAITSSSPMTSKDITRLLETSRDYDAVRDFTWLNPEGDAIYSNNPAVVGRNYRDRSFLREIVDGREWAVGGLVVSKATGNPVFGISRGIRDDKGALIGVVVAIILPEKLDTRLAVERSEGGGHALVDNKGMLVYRYPAINTKWEERNWSKQYPEFGEALKGKEVVANIFAPFEGKDRLVSITPVSSIGWVASAGKREEDVTGPILSSIANSALLFLSVALAAFFIAVALSRKITRPIAALHAHALALGSGEEPEQVGLNGVSEVQELAETFNTMAEKVRAREKALRESEQRWAVTLASVGDAVIAADTDGRVTFLNKVAVELTGWSMAEAAGKPVADVFRIVNEYTRAPVEDPVGKVLKSGMIVELANHTMLLSRGGGEVPIDDSGAPIRDEEGQTLGVVLIFRDITERRHAERALRQLSQFPAENPAPVLRIAADGALSYANEPAWNWLVTLGWQANGPLPVPVREVVADARGGSHAIEGEITNPDAVTFRVSAVQPPGEEYINIYAIDITKRKQTEESLRQLNETLEQRVAERTELAEQRSKQLQALAMELTEAEERERQRVADILHDDLQQILAAARMQLLEVCASLPHESLLANVEQMLGQSIGKARRLSHELSPAVLHHSGFLAAFQWLARQMKEQFGLDVQVESSLAQQFEGSPLKVFMFRAVQELLFNVVKHAGVKSAHIVLSGSESGLSITVSDNGCGFNRDILDIQTVKGGFGLLSLRERARYIGGSLVVESAPGKGSTFTLTVPVNVAKAAAIEHRAIDRQPFASTESLIPSGSGSIRVLLVDDHQVMRQGLIRLMNGKPNIELVGEAANGREAIEQARQHKPDVVIMDVSMPEMDGIEATRRIKAELPEVRVIGFSMHEDEQIARTMRAAGAEVMVSKTASSAELLETIYRITALAKVSR